MGWRIKEFFRFSKKPVEITITMDEENAKVIIHSLIAAVIDCTEDEAKGTK